MYKVIGPLGDYYQEQWIQKYAANTERFIRFISSISGK